MKKSISYKVDVCLDQHLVATEAQCECDAGQGSTAHVSMLQLCCLGLYGFRTTAENIFKKLRLLSMYSSLFQKTTLLNLANISYHNIWFISVMFYHDFEPVTILFIKKAWAKRIQNCIFFCVKTLNKFYRLEHAI